MILRFRVVAEQIAVRRGQPGDRLLDDRLRIVDELLHLVAVAVVIDLLLT